MELRQVWCVAYDDDTDGRPGVIRFGEWPKSVAEESYQVVLDRSARAPKKNLRIETRFVSEWSVE